MTSTTRYSNYKQENTSKVKCTLYFRDAEFSDYVTSCGENGVNAAECMKKYSDKDRANLVYDETSDNNLRYIGANPNNYVWFNEELWRIIGVMENIEDETGKKETRLKITRNEPIGKYSWDSSPSSVNDGYGVNEWSEADLKILLNDYYYNRKDGQTCYIGRNNASTVCNFSNIGIQEETKKMFHNALWKTGANETDYTSLKTNDYYKAERSTNTGKSCSSGTNCNDTVGRTVSWIGSIGLQYMSDYGYATSGGLTTSRTQCINTNVFAWNSSDITDCRENDWLYNSSTYQWMLTPYGWHPVIAHSAFHLTSDGRASTYNASEAYFIFPTLFLNSEIYIKKGYGTKENPYQLSINGYKSV